MPIFEKQTCSANLSYADLRGADLSDANLSHAILVGAKLMESLDTDKFIGANLKDAFELFSLQH